MRKALLAALALSAAPLRAEPAPAQAASAPETAMVADPCPVDRGTRWALDPAVLKEDWGWLCRYRAENRAVSARPDVVFLGDSITEGWIRADPGFFGPTRLDRGISGQTSPQLLVRFRQDVIALNPRVVHIMVGTNDLAGNTGPTTEAAWQDNIRTMVELARAHHIAVILGSVLPASHFGWAPAMKPARQIAALDAWLKDYAKAEHLVFADYYAAMVEKDGGLPEPLSGDGVHPTPAGYAVMRPIAERAIAEALKRR